MVDGSGPREQGGRGPESPEPGEEVTRLLADLAAGKAEANDALLARLYDELHALARFHMRQEPAGHTLQTTALVHEAFLRLGGRRETPVESRAHFMRIASQAMRRVLIDHARRKLSAKRGARPGRELLEEVAVFAEESPEDLLSLDTALKRLSEIDPQMAHVVTLRFFGGLTVEDTAQALSVSPKTVKRDWRMAKAWLKAEIGQGDN